MDERPDLLLGIVVTHAAKQQQQLQPQPQVQQQHVAGKVTTKTWTFNEHQARAVNESPVSRHSTPTTATTSSTVVHETDTIASPASQVRQTVTEFYLLAR